MWLLASYFVKEHSPDVSRPTPERALVTLAQVRSLHPAQGQRWARGLERRPCPG